MFPPFTLACELNMHLEKKSQRDRDARLTKAEIDGRAAIQKRRHEEPSHVQEWHAYETGLKFETYLTQPPNPVDVVDRYIWLFLGRRFCGVGVCSNKFNAYVLTGQSAIGAHVLKPRMTPQRTCLRLKTG